MAQVMYRGPSASTCGWWAFATSWQHPITLRPTGSLRDITEPSKTDINQVPYEVVEDLEAAIRDFVEFYNYRRISSGAEGCNSG